MKILQIGMGNVAGGLEAFVMNYYRVLVHMDIQFDFVCMYDKIAYEEEIRKLGGRIYYIPNVKKNYQGYIKELKKILKEKPLSQRLSFNVGIVPYSIWRFIMVVI